jgi:predicted hydrocarbon binding protein
MIVGPMKKKIINTFIIAFIIPTVILGGIGAFLISRYEKKVDDLETQINGEIATKYIFAQNLDMNHTIEESDIKLASVKAESTPTDALGKNDLDKILGKILKINVKANTVISESLFYEDDKISTVGERLQEFNMVLLPSDLKVNDYVDIRVLFPNGQDYIVLASKKIEKLSNTAKQADEDEVITDGSDTNTIWVKLDEDEILNMGSALVESYLTNGAKLYAVKYTNPASQLVKYEKSNLLALYDQKLTELLAAKKATKLQAYINSEVEKAKASNPEITPAEIATITDTASKTEITVNKNDITVSEIAKAMGIYTYEVEQIEEIKYYVSIVDKITNKVRENNKDKDEREIEKLIAEKTTNNNVAKEIVSEKYSSLKEEEKVNQITTWESKVASLIASKSEYENKLTKIPVEYKATYPAKPEVIDLIKSSPNILQEIKDNYSVDQVLQRRLVMDDTTVNDKNIEVLKEKLSLEIEAQRAERQAYIRSLIK